MARAAMHRQNVLQSSVARSRSRSQWLFLQSQRALDETLQIRFGQLAHASPRCAEPATLVERRWRDEE